MSAENKKIGTDLFAAFNQHSARNPGQGINELSTQVAATWSAHISQPFIGNQPQIISVCMHSPILGTVLANAANLNTLHNIAEAARLRYLELGCVSPHNYNLMHDITQYCPSKRRLI